MIIQGDCLDKLKEMDNESIDLVCTDPPYGYSFMGKDWDKAVPSVEIWKECLRVLKPGSFCMVMSAPRSDVQNAMISRLMQAGFRLDFAPIYWTYASGFPKAGNIGKLVDKRLGVKRELVERSRPDGKKTGHATTGFVSGATDSALKRDDTAISLDAKKLQGSYAGFQPKPAVEVIIVAMKPLSEKTFVDQALKNGKGITWLDDCRVPTTADDRTEYGIDGDEGSPTVNDYGDRQRVAYQQHQQGRFPANLLVSDDVLNDGLERKTGNLNKRSENKDKGWGFTEQPINHTGDSGSYSRYFDLDKWASTLPFLIVPKASKSEKNKGLEHMPDKLTAGLPMRSVDGKRGGVGGDGSITDRKVTMKNGHPTVKPLKLMSYLITLGSRSGDTVLDPFCGSGTTILAAKQLGRVGIGIEREPEYAEIAQARLDFEDNQIKQIGLL